MEIAISGMDGVEAEIPQEAVEAERSIEELLLELDICDHYADMRVQPWQEAIEPGTCYVCFDKNSDRIFYGMVLPFRHKIRVPGPNYYRRVKVFSSQQPKGEIGITHVAWITGVITRAQFEKAYAVGWPESLSKFAKIVAGDPMWDMLPS